MLAINLAMDMKSPKHAAGKNTKKPKYLEIILGHDATVDTQIGLYKLCALS